MTLTHERVDDIPLLFGLMHRMRLAEVLDQCLTTHGLHQGLSTGQLVVGWLAYILSEGDHAKASVRDWVARHQQTVADGLDTVCRDTEFTDDRLGLVLRRLSDSVAWAHCEAALWDAVATVYALPAPTQVRLDASTFSGLHTVEPGGLMQYGHSKAHRPDWPQVKLMAAVAEPAGWLLASDLHPGQRADDGLYLPLVARVRRTLGRTGLLYCGDNKMAALATRAALVAAGEYYLVPLPLGKEAAATVAAWQAAGTDGTSPLTLVWRGEDEAATLLGGGYETTRPQAATVDGQPVAWDERLVVLRSAALLQQEQARLATRLAKAEAALAVFALPPARGRRQYRDRASLEAAVAAKLDALDVTGLLQVTVAEEMPGRQARWVVTAVTRQAEAVQAAEDRLGWRVLATNAPASRLPLGAAVVTARDGWQIEQQFHQLHDHPLGITPLQVRCEDQLCGLVRLLTLALRVLTLLTSLVRQTLAEQDATMAGLYPGQATRTTEQPTARRLLRAIADTEITLSVGEVAGHRIRYLTPLPPVLRTVLVCCRLPATIYTRLAETTA